MLRYISYSMFAGNCNCSYYSYVEKALRKNSTSSPLPVSLVFETGCCSGILSNFDSCCKNESWAA